MVLKIFFTPNEIRKFFEDNGYKVEIREFGMFSATYHNRSEWVETTDDAVVINGRHVRASTLFEKVVEYRLKRMIAPKNLKIKRAIEKTFKNMVK